MSETATPNHWAIDVVRLMTHEVEYRPVRLPVKPRDLPWATIQEPFTRFGAYQVFVTKRHAINELRRRLEDKLGECEAEAIRALQNEEVAYKAYAQWQLNHNSPIRPRRA